MPRKSEIAAHAVPDEEPGIPAVRRADQHSGEPGSYLGRLTRTRLLTSSEEIELAQRVRAGDVDAKRRLIEANMRLVINIAKNYHSALVPFEDLVQEGAIGLMTACERFDPSRGFRFSTYATHWIRQAISRAIDNKSRSIRVPAHVSEMVRKIERARAELTRAGDDDPSVEDIARHMDVAPARISAILRAAQEPVSLDMLVGSEESTPLGSLVFDENAADPEDAVIRQEVEAELQRVLDSLSERERAVMRMRLGFVEDETQVLQEIGRELHISRERVRQIEAQALKRLRAAARRHHLREYLTE